MNGTVKFFSIEKHYGFIVGDDGLDYFVHLNDLVDKIETGDHVSYDTETTEKEPKAVNVVREK